MEAWTAWVAGLLPWSPNWLSRSYFASLLHDVLYTNARMIPLNFWLILVTFLSQILWWLLVSSEWEPKSSRVWPLSPIISDFIFNPFPNIFSTHVTLEAPSTVQTRLCPGHFLFLNHVSDICRWLASLLPLGLLLSVIISEVFPDRPI